MTRFTLYSTLGCHLCEQAEALLRLQQAVTKDFNFVVIEIVNSDELLEAYGERIPVLRCVKTEKELGWPFTEASLAEWLESALNR